MVYSYMHLLVLMQHISVRKDSWVSLTLWPNKKWEGGGENTKAIEDFVFNSNYFISFYIFYSYILYKCRIFE